MKNSFSSILYIALLLFSKFITISSIEVNYGEALQKSLFFYEVQQAGVLPEWNEVSWRADSMENDFIPGGWFDAGDHFKFTHTIAYTAAVLAWGFIEYGDAVEKVGLAEKYKNNLKWGLDYIVLADQGDSVVGTIGKDAFDHSWWGSPEMYLRKMKLRTGDDKRPYDLVTTSSTIALCAAALAAGYIVFKDDTYLKHAKSLYELADETRTAGKQGMAMSYYPLTDFYDELFYAANWMYLATDDRKYLDECESDFVPEFPTEIQSTTLKFTWGFCWDDHSQAAALLYAINTGKEEWIEQVKHHLEYWTTGYDGKQVKYTPDGMAWLFQWGATRHAANTAWIAVVAADRLFKDTDEELYNKYKKFAKTQMDYFFGNNDLGISYVLGMGEKNPKTVHHRGASGIHDDDWIYLGTEKGDGSRQTKYAHVLYGALEGGPNDDGSFTDSVSAYQNTEVAIDYNAGYTAALCSMIKDYGGKKLDDFPIPEKPKWPEFLISASCNGNTKSYIEIRVFVMNHSAWPARVIKDLSFNYFFDVTTLLEGGLSVSDIKPTLGSYQPSGEKTSISEPIQYKDNIYYVKVSYTDATFIMPTGPTEYKDELIFKLSLPDNANVGWDTSKHYSFKDLDKGGITPYITMYDGDKLIWGIEPDGTEPESS